MKEKILEIADRLRNDEITTDVAKWLLSDIVNRFITVYEQEPPDDIELLVKAPDGVIHLSCWRPAYGIFTCQSKHDSSDNWSWKLI